MFLAVSATDPPTSTHPALADAEDLHELDAARAELWVSGLLADLNANDTAGMLTALQEAHQAEEETAATARLLAAVISVVADPDVARQASNVSSPDGIEHPPWAALLGKAKPVDAMAVVVEEVRRSVIVRFAHRDDDRHLMLVELDDSGSESTVVSDLRFAPDGLFEEELGDESIELVPVPLDGLGEELASALEAADLDTPSIALNRLVARRRIESLGADFSNLTTSPSDEPAADVVSVPGLTTDGDPLADAADREGDAAAVELLESALAKHFAADGPNEAAYEAAASAIRKGPGAGADDIASVCAAAGLDGSEPDEQLVLRFVSAYAAPHTLDAFSPEEREAISHLEWADWLGAVIGLTRAGEGTVVSPQQMVKAINRCPEITTTIPKADADYVAWSFELTLHAWSLAGVLDDEERLTGFGALVLPRAFRAAWAPPASS